jgi:hypothetical protein
MAMTRQTLSRDAYANAADMPDAPPAAGGNNDDNLLTAEEEDETCALNNIDALIRKDMIS